MGKHSRSSLFLMELIIAILFFSLAGAVCIRLFVTAHSISQNTIARNHAITQTQNLAEAWLSAEGSQELLAAALPGLEVSEKAGGTSFCLFFDKNWEPCSASEAENAAFAAELYIPPSEAADSLIHAEITVSALSREETLYSLSLVHHISERRQSLDN